MLPQWTCQKNKTHQPLIFSIHFQEKKTNSPRTKPTSLLVEGYAFYENIIGVAHRKTNGEEAFNLTLRNMIYKHELHDEGFSSYVTLRDKSSGHEDKQLLGEDGYPKYMFLSINVHTFSTVEAANEPVLEQCCKMQQVREKHTNFSYKSYINLTSYIFFNEQIVTNPNHNVFGYKYLPVTEESNKTGCKLLVLSDVMMYSDAFCILTCMYGDKSHRHKLPHDFGKKYPHVISKFFSNIDDLPSYIVSELGL